jgi:hypothetical protein
MNNVLNRSFFHHKTTKQDGFNNLCTIIHQVGEATQFQGEVYLKKQLLGTFVLKVTKEATNTQIHIDASAFDPIAQINLTGAVLANTTYLLQEKGYTVFYASGKQEGFHIILKQGDKELFDTRKLNKGDMVALTPIHAGDYIVKNEEGGASMTVTVKLHEKGKSPHPATLKPVTVTCSSGGFDPKSASLSQMQPLLITIQAPANISFSAAVTSDGTKAKK